MNKNVKTSWIELLRSGQLNQIRYSLRNSSSSPFVEGYDILGSLCELHSRETGNKWQEGICYLGAIARLPDEVLEWSGLSRKEERELIVLNDEGTTFEEFADILEKE